MNRLIGSHSNHGAEALAKVGRQRYPSNALNEQALALRVVFLSDAQQDRNGVDAYYRDLVEHLGERIDTAELFSPNAAEDYHYRRLTLPMPGDRTQQICVPKVAHLYKCLREINPHVVLMATPGPFGFFGLFAGKRLHARLLAGFHTNLEGLVELYWNRIVGAVTRRSLEMLSGILFRQAEITVVNAQHMTGLAHRLGASAVETVGTPIARQFLTAPITPLATELKNILYVGRLAPEKNVPALLEAAERLPHLHFTFVGNGPLQGLMRNQAQSLHNVEYLGWLPRTQVVSALDRANMLVLPSHLEAFGTVALEAMARNRLVLVSNHCGILKWPALAEGVFHVREGEHVANAIVRITHIDPGLRLRKAVLARQAARELNEQTLQQWLGILTEVGNPLKVGISR